MAKVTGIGGIFFKAKDPALLREWYQKHLGLEIQPWGGVAFSWHTPDAPNPHGVTIWSVSPETTDQFDPSTQPFMINYRVDDLAGLLAKLRADGCQVLDKTDDSEFGKFGWVMDPEGNKVELWQPPEGPMG